MIIMGDRVSITFVTKNSKGRIDDESVAIFDHWGGKEFPKKASDFIKKTLLSGEVMYPSDIIAPFLFSLGENGKDVYFGKTKKDGDNSDNGHYRIDCKTGDIIHLTAKDWNRDEKHPVPADVAINAIRTASSRIDFLQKELEKEIEKLENVS